MTGTAHPGVPDDAPTAGIAASRPFVIDAAKTTMLAGAADYRAAFREMPAMLLDGVFAAPLMERLLARADKVRFVPHDIAQLGHREKADDGGVAAALCVVLDRSPLLRWLEDVTGAPPLRGVAGSFAQARTGTGDGLAWHDDRIDPRRALGIVVNLTSQPYEGGLFEMRCKGSPDPLLAHHHDKPGTALIFAIRPDLEHRVTPLVSGGPRRVFAGWFLAAQ